MKVKPSVLTVRVPKDLKKRIEKLADSQGVSINQFALYSFTKEVLETESSDYYKKYLQNKTKIEILNNFDKSILKVKSRPVPDWDKT